jgi:hypothetical protein
MKLGAFFILSFLLASCGEPSSKNKEVETFLRSKGFKLDLFFSDDEQSACIVNNSGDVIICPIIERIELKDGKVIGKKQPYKIPNPGNILSDEDWTKEGWFSAEFGDKISIKWYATKDELNRQADK